MSVVQVIRSYQSGDFPNGNWNEEILTQEIEDAAGVTPKPAVNSSSAQLDCVFTTLIDAGVQSALDAVIAAHQGDAFADDVQRVENNPQQDTAADNVEVQMVSLASGPLRAGSYVVEWYGEHKLSDNTAGGATKLYAYIGRNGAAPSVRGADSKPAHWDWSQVFGKLPFTLKDGETLDVELRLQRQGGTLTTETAQGQRMRIFLTRVGD